MTTEFDPKLRALFVQADETLDPDQFIADLMRQVDRQRQRTLLIWSAIGLFVLAVFAMLSGPVIATVELVTQLLPVSLFEFETDLLNQLLSPINSVAAAAAVAVLAIAKFFRRIFR